jgi:hypothetical protein
MQIVNSDAGLKAIIPKLDNGIYGFRFYHPLLGDEKYKPTSFPSARSSHRNFRFTCATCGKRAKKRISHKRNWETDWGSLRRSSANVSEVSGVWM